MPVAGELLLTISELHLAIAEDIVPVDVDPLRWLLQVALSVNEKGKRN